MKQTKQEELLQSQTNAEGPIKGSYRLITHELIEGTPFHVIEQESGWFLVMGSHRLTEDFSTKEEALNELDSEKWKIILQMIIIVNKKSREFEKII